MRRKDTAPARRMLSRRSPFGLVVGVVGLLIAGLSPGCSPTEPTGSTEGVTVYETAGYQGQSRRLGADERDLDDVVGPCGNNTWDDCISSIRVPAGWQAILYEHPDFEGRSLTVTSDINDLIFENMNGLVTCGSWDDCASSVRVTQQ